MLIDPGFPWRASVSTVCSSCTHADTHKSTYWHLLEFSGAQVGEVLPIYEQRRKQARCLCVVSTPLEQAFFWVHKKRHTPTQDTCTHTNAPSGFLCCARTQTKQLLALWCLSYATQLLTAQSACEWQTCVSDLLLHKQRWVMRKGKYGKEKKECVKW